MADTTVKYFDSTMTGAPTLTGTVGSMIGILDACLVNGFGQVTLDSLSVTGGVATATRAAGHPVVKDGVAFIAGASVGLLNGEQKVTAVTATTFQFATTAGNGAATGSITVKVAAAGWTKLFASTNLAAYKSSDVGSTGCVLRVDDTAAQTARVVGYESMTDINTGVNAFPLTTQVSGGDFWDKSSAANATANQWMLVADGRFFYFARGYRTGAAPNTFNENQLSVFGDMVPTKSGDAYCCVLSGETTAQFASTVTSSNNYWFGASGASGGMYSPRSYSTLGASIPMGKSYPVFNGLAGPGTSGAQAAGMNFPNPSDGGMYVVPHYLFEAPAGTSTNVYRGNSPGFYCSPQSVAAGTYNTRDSITGVTGLVGKVLKAIGCNTNAPNGVCFIDVTGPWR